MGASRHLTFSQSGVPKTFVLTGSRSLGDGTGDATSLPTQWNRIGIYLAQC